jgi:hypothetical protein
MKIWGNVVNMLPDTIKRTISQVFLLYTNSYKHCDPGFQWLLVVHNEAFYDRWYNHGYPSACMSVILSTAYTGAELFARRYKLAPGSEKALRPNLYVQLRTYIKPTLHAPKYIHIRRQ